MARPRPRPFSIADLIVHAGGVASCVALFVVFPAWSRRHAANADGRPLLVLFLACLVLALVALVNYARGQTRRGPDHFSAAACAVLLAASLLPPGLIVLVVAIIEAMMGERFRVAT